MSQPLPRYLPPDHHAWEHKLARILLNVGEPAPPRATTRKLVGNRSAEGDEQRLRYIPVVGARGVGGAIPGTRPDRSLA